MVHANVTHHFKIFSPFLWWKLLLDINHQISGGPLCFEETEPGYLKSMFQGLDFILGSIDSELSLTYLNELHGHTIHHTQYHYRVETERGIESIREPFSKGFRKNTGTEFGLVTEGNNRNCSEAGFQELLTRLKNQDSYFNLIATNKITKKKIVFNHQSDNLLKDSEDIKHLFDEYHLAISIPACTTEILEKRLQKIIAIYNKSITTAITPQEKIRAIVICVQGLELTHPFYDGNGRTHMLLLILKLLVQNDLLPALLDCADRFDAFSIGELTQEIIKGQRQFETNCLIDKAPPDGIILYLENNLFLTEIVALQLAGSIPVWYDLATPIKNTFSAIMLEILKNKKSFTYPELQLLVQTVTDCSEKAITSLNPVTIDISLFERQLEEKDLLQPKPSFLGFVYKSVFGFFFDEPSRLVIANKSQQHISTP